MWGITTYFNPVQGCGQLRLDNFHRFRNITKTQGLKLCVVELLYDDSQPELRPVLDGEMVLHVHTSRSCGVLWQKERMLNIALNNLPKDCDKVCWLDGDIIFEDNDWVSKTELALTKCHVVQPFSVVCMLPRNWDTNPNEIQEVLSSSCHRIRASSVFASLYNSAIKENPDVKLNLSDTYPTVERYRDQIEVLLQSVGGTPGLCWAARREIFGDFGFYDYNIVGGGDSVLHAAIHSNVSYPESPFSPAHYKTIFDYISKPNFEHLIIGCVDGLILHMWHGKIKDRKYAQRYILLQKYNFNPQDHLVLNNDQVWGWSENAPQELIDGVAKYFLDRKEKIHENIISREQVEKWCQENNLHLLKGWTRCSHTLIHINDEGFPYCLQCVGQ